MSELKPTDLAKIDPYGIRKNKHKNSLTDEAKELLSLKSDSVLDQKLSPDLLKTQAGYLFSELAQLLGDENKRVIESKTSSVYTPDGHWNDEYTIERHVIKDQGKAFYELEMTNYTTWPALSGFGGSFSVINENGKEEIKYKYAKLEENQESRNLEKILHTEINNKDALIRSGFLLRQCISNLEK